MTDETVALPDVDQRALGEVSRMGGEGERVLSVYLDLGQPEVRTPSLLSTEIDSRLKEAEARLGDGEAGAAEAIESCLNRVRRRLHDIDLSDHTLRAVAVFCEESGEPRAFGLRRPLEFTVAAAYAERAALEPLLEAMKGSSWAVALVSRTHGRIFRGSDLGLAEVRDVDDVVHRWHSQGGWSQARFQRGMEKETADHIGHVCNLLFQMHESRPFDHLVVGGPEEIWHLVDDKLHPYLRERLAGHITINVERSTADEVLEHVQPFVREQRERIEREAIEHLEAGLGTGDQAVSGLTDVLAALDERRVGTLLVTGGPLDEAVERAIDAAIAQSAEILVFEDDSLEPFGGIGALLRY